MRIVSPKQMKKIEDYSEKLGVSKMQLMENAGKALAKIIDEFCRKEGETVLEENSIVFLAGKGNNGGDCFAAAKILAYQGYKIVIVEMGGPPTSELAKTMFEQLPLDKIEVIEGFRSKNVEVAIEAAELDYMSVPRDLSSDSLDENKDLNPLDTILLKEKKRIGLIKAAILSASVVVDGVFGTGFHSQLDKNIAAIFNIGTSAYKISVDIPSGGNCISGAASIGTFKADETITFGYIKTGLVQYPLRKYCGKITTVDIGIPKKAFSIIDDETKYFRTDRYQLSGFPPNRERDAHKGTFGSVLVIGGSSSMRGAAAFAALGALRSGVGLVKLASVEKCIDSMASLIPEATYLELECDDYGYILYDSNINAISEAMKKADAIVIGCGMGVTPDTIELMNYIIKNSEIPIIIDADGINCIASDIDILLKKRTDIIITPHVAEMARLLSCENSLVSENRIFAAEKFAEKYDVTVVLKGAGTVIVNGKCTAINHTGNAGMSRGGSGDILAGIIGSIIAQGSNIFDGVCAGVYIHGLAGDIAAKKLGQEAMLPRDIINCLSDSFGILKDMH